MIRVLPLLVALVLVGCGEPASSPDTTPTTTTTTHSETTTTEETAVSTTEPSYDSELSPIVEQARADLAARLEVEESSIAVTSAEFVTWSDGSLGCPQPGMMYTQALVDGSRVVLEHGARFYDYHAGADAEPFLCASDAEDGGHDTVPPLEGAV